MRGAAKNLHKLATFVAFCIIVATPMLIDPHQVAAAAPGGGTTMIFQDYENVGSDEALVREATAQQATWAVTTDQSHSPTHSLRVEHHLGALHTGGGPGPTENFPTPVKEVYVRFYIRFSPNFSFAVISQKIARINGVSSTNPPGFPYFVTHNGERTLRLGQQFMYLSPEGDHNWAGKQNVGTPIAFQNGRWYCIEGHMKLNTPGQANGIAEFWIDGELKHQHLDLQYVGPTLTDYVASDGVLTGLHITSLKNEQPNRAGQTEYNWYDDIVVSTKRIGCLPNVTDKDPPSTPTGVRITNP